MNKKLLTFLVPFAVAVALSVMFLGYTIFESAKKLLIQATVQRYVDIMTETRNDMLTRVDKLAELASVVAQTPAVHNLLKLSPEIKDKEAEVNYSKQVRAVNTILMRLGNSTQGSANLAIFNASGRMVVDMTGPLDQSIQGMPYYPIIVSGNPTRGAKLHYRSKLPTLYAGVPVIANGVVIGGVAISMNMADFTNSLRRRMEGASDTVLEIMDNSHERMASSALEGVFGVSHSETPEHRALLQSENVILPANADLSRLGMRQSVPELGLNLLLSTDRKQLMGPATILSRTVFVYVAVAGAMAIALAWVVIAILLRRQATSEAKLSQLVELSGLPTWEWNGVANTLRVNEYVWRMLGMAVGRNQISRNEYLSLIHPDDVTLLPAMVDNPKRKTPMPISVALRLRHKKGHWHWVEVIGHITRWDAHGNSLHGMGLYHDIHEARTQALNGLAYQQRLEATVERVNEESVVALRRERALLNNVINNIPDFIYFTDVDVHYIGGNKALLGMYGVNTEMGCEAESVSEIFRSTLSAEKLAINRERDLKVLASGEMLRMEEIVVFPGGKSLHLETLKSPMQDDTGKVIGLVGISRDITLRKQAEDAILRATEEATAANRAKSDFLANMSHEIRTPLNGILGLNHLALQHNPASNIREYLEKINLSAHALLGIINDILDFSKIEAGRMELECAAFRPREVLQATVDMLQPQAKERGNTLTLNVAPDVPARIMGDSLRFGQIMLNLANNAVKFTHNGMVCVGIKAKNLEGARRLLVYVEDTGIGLTDTQIKTLFLPFVQADSSTTRKYGGTGLGLAISSSLVEAMKSTLQVRSTIGQGSCFYFELACIEPDSSEEDLQDTLQPDNSTILQGKTVLLVEDNEINQLIAQEILQNMGCTIALAVNGEEAITKALAGQFDAVLMDIQMPIMDGLTAARKLRESGYTRPIIAMTANAMHEDRLKALEAGMEDHVPKPINFDELKKVLALWMEKNPLQ